ncbi:lactonase family protein [Gracilibacillus timonensis]|uniref:lactonase family protein n=1 Tax=Gracilibacillus timonensis TaxID=1816696 RepID=UPI00082496CD|nr:lactonase family protein [Gracilibacillus timonensis]
MTTYSLVIGSYGKEEDKTIQFVSYHSDKQQFQWEDSLSGVASPSFLAVGTQASSLYTISEQERGEVIFFNQGKHWQENSRQSTGAGPCHLHIKEESGYLLTANYGGGTISLHPIKKDGTVQPCTDTYKLGDVQNVSHPHMCYPIGKDHHYLVTDLGQDQLFLFRVDDKRHRLIKKHAFSLSEGSGPRHIAIHPSLGVVYIVNEFSSTVSVYQYDEYTKHLEWKQQIATVEAHETEGNYGADIHLSPDGAYLYTSNRGRDTISRFQVLRNGSLSYLDQKSTGGKWPRNFTITNDGEFMFIANEHSDQISVLQVGEKGELMKIKTQFKMNAPTCLLTYERNVM